MTSYTSFSQRSVAKNMPDFYENWRHFHDNTYFILMVVTTDQAQFWAHGSFADNIVLVVLNPFLKCFRDKFSTFDHLVKDMRVIRVYSCQWMTINKFENLKKLNVGKDVACMNMNLQRVIDEFSYSFLFRLYLSWHEIDKHI
jgi:hypothetical protein